MTRAPEGLSVIGRPMRKVDGLAKATGRARYTDDIALPGMLHGKILRSPHAHARILEIDASRAEAMRGVRAVVLGADMPMKYGIIPWTRDERALCVDRVRHIGDAVAAVAAIDEDTAIRALDEIRVEYEPLRAFFDPHEAIARKSGPWIHEPRKGRSGNVTKVVKMEFGDVEEALSGAHAVVQGDYFFEGTTHAPIEPHCAIGLAEPGGRLTVWSSTQVPHYLHRELARVLELDPARVRVIQPPVGGAFGGKSEPFDLEFCVAKLSEKSGRPVKILYTREEVFYAHRGRHPFHMKYRTGANKDGTIVAVDADIVLDGGAYASFGLVTTYYSGQLLTAPYALGSYRYHSARAYTNKPACGPKRGHGSVQPRFALEAQLDMLAEKLGMDPIELRRRNFIGSNARTVNELRITSNGFLECLDSVERASDWKLKRRRLPYGRGVGVAGSTYISGTNYPIYPNEMPQSGAQILVDRSGRVSVFSGASEIGQGADSMVAYIAAEELGVPLEHVRVLRGDTDFTPVDLGAYSSRVTFMLGNACIHAARRIKRKVQKVVGEEWEVPAREVLLAGGFALHRKDTGTRMPIRKAFNLAEARFGTLGATGSYNTPKDVHGSYRGATIGASPAYSFTAHVAEVEVDPETGFVNVQRIWIAHDCGRALNPVLVEGQMEGSAYMGFAEAIMEAHVFKSESEGKAGLLDAPSLLDYRIPTSMDTPELRSLIVESLDPEGPYGAKEAGEGPLHPSIPAIANAIYDAVGVRVNSLPFSPPRVWRAIRRKASSGKGRSNKPRRAVAAPAAKAGALALLIGAGGCDAPISSREAGSSGANARLEAAPPQETQDWEIVLRETAAARALDEEESPDFGSLVARIGLRFAGAPYGAGLLERPDAERLVVNLRAFDCVTLVEHVLAIALVSRGDVPLERPAAVRDAYSKTLRRIRYRSGRLDGYSSRLHYFSEWIGDGEAKGILRDVTRDLGGVVDSSPINFMSRHPNAYPALAAPDVLGRIRETEERLSRQGRVYIPQDRIKELQRGIRDGDVIAATSSVAGLDVAHAGIAIWRDGRLHLLHAPLEDSPVEVSALPLAERILRIKGQDGIIAARPTGRLEDGGGG